MSLEYVIDGYNLLHALPSMPPGSWEQKRCHLLDRMASRRPHGRNRLTVVFDSHQGFGDRHMHGDIQVVYTAGETTDDWIIEYVRRTANPRLCVVVTDDKGLRAMIRGTGARWEST